MDYINKYHFYTQYKGYLCERIKTKFFDFSVDQSGYYQGIQQKKHLLQIRLFINTFQSQIESKIISNLLRIQLGRNLKIQNRINEYIMKARLLQENINDVLAIIGII
ncbi:unnamed protein product [Paramecium sonneborni]|uniref:Uncharacterized protein n=1 Tax=Paramecium sonneborni TaxID=65129 RepID=A0A8S1M770_9CILI|nr:unnamed protein product [Paramecium sonneborni]